MEDIDDYILKLSMDFIDRSHQAKKPFFLWLNPTRMHIFTFLSPKYKALEGKDNYGLQEAGMAQFDDIVGSVIAKLEALGIDETPRDRMGVDLVTVGLGRPEIALPHRLVDNRAAAGDGDYGLSPRDPAGCARCPAPGITGRRPWLR